MSKTTQEISNLFPESGEQERDATGFRVFSGGSIGAAHVMAHRLLDDNQPALGRKLLGQWLEDRSGSGSDWVHIQFHMAVFELATGEWDAAYARYLDYVLPVAAIGEDALTDAPALLWRLVLTAPAGTELDWEPLRCTALARMQRPSEPFTELHNLMAIAGAGDVQNMDHWMRSRRSKAPAMHLVRGMAVGLRAFVTRQYRHATEQFTKLAPQFADLGGSGAQNQLFEQFALASRQRLGETHVPAGIARAA
jgi:hypothetical protein